MSAALWEADVNLAEWLFFAFTIEQQEPHAADDADVFAVYFSTIVVLGFVLGVLFAAC